MSRQAARLFWNEREMKIDLPDLGSDFNAAMLSGKINNSQADNSEIKIQPGVYLLTSSKVKKSEVNKSFLNHVKFLDGLYLPPKTQPDIYIVNKTTNYLPESKQGDFKFEIASGEKISNVFLFIKRPGWRGFEKHSLVNSEGFEYTMNDSTKILNSGIIEYCVAVESNNKTFTFPEGIKTTPDDWDFYSTKFWNAKILGSSESVDIFDPLRDMDDFVFTPYSRDMRYNLDYKNGSNGETSSVLINLTFGNENEIPFGLQLNIADLIKPLQNQLNDYTKIVVRARSVGESGSFGINLLTTEGGSYNSPKINLKSDWQDIEIPLDSFKPGRSLDTSFFISAVSSEVLG